MTGCSNSADSSRASADPGSVSASPSAVTMTITTGTAPNSRAVASPPSLVVAGQKVDATHADWAAVSGTPAPDASSITSPAWRDVPIADGAAVLTFSEGPLPIAVSVVGYDDIGPDGLPVGEPVEDHGVLPAARVTIGDRQLLIDTTDRPEYLAVQFRWTIPDTQRAPGQEDNASVTAAYLLHLTPAS